MKFRITANVLFEMAQAWAAENGKEYNYAIVEGIAPL